MTNPDLLNKDGAALLRTDSRTFDLDGHLHTMLICYCARTQSRTRVLRMYLVATRQISAVSTFSISLLQLIYYCSTIRRATLS